MGHRVKAFSAIRWTALGIAIKIVLQLLQTIILARLLVRQEIGVMAIALSITMYVMVFVDMGVSNAIIHEKHLKQSDRSSLYWLNVLIGLGMTILFAVASPWISGFFREPLLQDMLFIIAPYFLIFSAGQQLKVVAEKEMRFSRLIAVEIFSVALGFATTIGLAWSGYGVRSVAIGFLCTAITFTALAWLFLSQGWRPDRNFELSGIGKFLKYGLHVIGNNMLSGINAGADVFLGGRILGLGSLGVYSLPRDLMINASAVINAVATRVGLPLMAQSQDNKDRLRQIYLKTMRMTASINMPVFMAIFVFAPEVVLILFGDRWTSSAPLLRWLSVWGMLRSMAQPVGSLIFAVGRADLAMRWNFGLMLVMLPSIWVGLQFGMTGLAVTMVVISALAQIPNWWFLVQPLCGASWVEYFSQIFRPLAATAMAVAAVYGALTLVSGLYARLTMGLLTGGVIYIGASYLINREWLLSMLELLFKKRLTPLEPQ